MNQIEKLSYKIFSQTITGLILLRLLRKFKAFCPENSDIKNAEKITRILTNICRKNQFCQTSEEKSANFKIGRIGRIAKNKQICLKFAKNPVSFIK